MRVLPLIMGCLLTGAVQYGAKEGGTLAPDGKTEVQLDLPSSEQRHNIESRGQGCCVQTSINHAARWQNVPALVDFQEWVKAKGLPGGAYPGAVDQRIPACAKDRGYATPKYLQVQGKDLEILKAACKSGRMPSVTYSYSATGRYGGQRIAHMVSLLAAGEGRGPDGKGWWVVLDNNFVGEGRNEWMSESEFWRSYTAGSNGWAVILLDVGPPPPPCN